MTVHAPAPRAPRAAARKRRALAAVAGFVLVTTVGAGLYLTVAGSPETEIRTVAGAFATAVDREDYPSLLGVLCVQEAAGIVEDDDYDPTAEPVAPSAPGEPVVTDVLVDDEGETATARAALPGRSPVTIHLRREGERWTVCHS
ncbi:hypothetical protein GCM10009609_48740 [Pseudonocardia aurantiaca]|uniref:DUF4878 domain-containing protein n=1 Tax=Pseudonocardia aurantiaca TaxID=75290 RepID=A0ABW4FXS3_9PSEU